MMDERYKKDWLFALFGWVINKLAQPNANTLFLLLRIAIWKRNQSQSSNSNASKPDIILISEILRVYWGTPGSQ